MMAFPEDSHLPTPHVSPAEQDSYQAMLLALSNNHQRREARAVQTPFGQLPVIFCDNDYLGLSTDQRLIQASVEATHRYGTGSGASRLVSGTTQAIICLEEQVAEWKNTQAALVLNSGYQANVAILQAILTKDDVVLFDRLNHASLIDGIRLSGAAWHRYRHLHLEHLQALLEKHANRLPSTSRLWILTDSLFSMDGDYPDLRALLDLSERYGAYTLVDEAHAAGVFGGRKRSGLCEAFDVSKRVSLQMGTFSKALGGFGAYVAGSRVLIETIVNRGRGFIYSTALPPGVIAAASKAVDIVQQDPLPAQRLWENVHYTHQALSALIKPDALCTPDLRSQIISLPIGESRRALQASDDLLVQGFFVQAIRSPTVPVRTERLRVTISARHTHAEIDALAASLLSCL